MRQMWPQTEAIKVYAIRHIAGDEAAGKQAQTLLCLMFEHWFADHPVWVNRVSDTGEVIWPEALTRLFYHLVIALTEGARAGLWPGIPGKK
jgi:mannose-6-phosphate isomerase